MRVFVQPLEWSSQPGLPIPSRDTSGFEVGPLRPHPSQGPSGLPAAPRTLSGPSVLPGKSRHPAQACWGWVEVLGLVPAWERDAPPHRPELSILLTCGQPPKEEACPQVQSGYHGNAQLEMPP